MDTITLSQFLTDPEHSVISIPRYQRPYSWTNIQLDDLVNDIDLIVDEEESDHFIGLLVCTKQKKKKHILHQAVLELF